MKHGISLDGSSLIKSHRVKFIRTTTVELTKIPRFIQWSSPIPWDRQEPDSENPRVTRMRSPQIARTRQWDLKSYTDEISSDRQELSSRIPQWMEEFGSPWMSREVPGSPSLLVAARIQTLRGYALCSAGNISPLVPVRRNHSTNDVAFQAGTARQSRRFGSMVMKRVWRIKRKNLAACRIDTQHAETWI